MSYSKHIDISEWVCDQTLLSRRDDCLWHSGVPQNRLQSWPTLQQYSKESINWNNNAILVTDQNKKEFDHLVEKWQEDTIFLSSITQMVIHPAYQRIIGMGQTALPLILNELKESPAHWFWALQAISGENPAKDAATFDEGVESWVKWGQMRGYIR